MEEKPNTHSAVAPPTEFGLATPCHLSLRPWPPFPLCSHRQGEFVSLPLSHRQTLGLGTADPQNAQHAELVGVLALGPWAGP